MRVDDAHGYFAAAMLARPLECQSLALARERVNAAKLLAAQSASIGRGHVRSIPQEDK